MSFSLLRRGLIYVALAGLKLTLSGCPRIRRDLLAFAPGQYSRECHFDCITLVIRTEPLVTVVEIEVFSVIGQCL